MKKSSDREKRKEAAKKAVLTRKRKAIGRKVWEKRKQIMLAVKPLLLQWSEANRKYRAEPKCVVCGETMRNTLDKHHVDPSFKEQWVWLCASCHRILDKASSEEKALQDLETRHARFE